jgi:hypothetical protein
MPVVVGVPVSSVVECQGRKQDKKTNVEEDKEE